MADADAEKEFLELSSKARGDTDWIVPALKLINVNNVLAFVDDTSTGRLIDPPSGTSREDAAKAVLAKIRGTAGGAGLCPAASEDAQNESLRSFSRLVQAAEEPARRAAVHGVVRSRPAADGVGAKQQQLSEKQIAREMEGVTKNLAKTVVAQMRGRGMEVFPLLTPNAAAILKLYEGMIEHVKDGSSDAGYDGWSKDFQRTQVILAPKELKPGGAKRRAAVRIFSNFGAHGAATQPVWPLARRTPGGSGWHASASPPPGSHGTPRQRRRQRAHRR